MHFPSLCLLPPLPSFLVLPKQGPSLPHTPTPLTPVLRRLWERRKGSDEWSSPRQGGRSLLPPMAFMASDARGTSGPLLGGVA